MATTRPDRSPVDRVFTVAENVLYAAIAVVLGIGAAVLVVEAGWHLVADLGDGADHAVRDVLDRLLLAFILVELLAAVRATLRERRLLAEPFLLVGMIATIKEIVVLAIEAREVVGEHAFADHLRGLGVLGALLLSLGVTTLVLRRKEREPEE
jgi:uncharacterized membrane protein (DUF373 family)